MTCGNPCVTCFHRLVLPCICKECVWWSTSKSCSGYVRTDEEGNNIFKQLRWTLVYTHSFLPRLLVLAHYDGQLFASPRAQPSGGSSSHSGRQSFTRPAQQTPSYTQPGAVPSHGTMGSAAGINGGYNANFNNNSYNKPTPSLPPRPRPEDVRREKEQALTLKLQVMSSWEALSVGCSLAVGQDQMILLVMMYRCLVSEKPPR